MVVVKKKKGETDDKLIQRFRKEVIESGIVEEARDRTRHTKDSEKKQERMKQKKFSIKLEKKRSNR